MPTSIFPVPPPTVSIVPEPLIVTFPLLAIVNLVVAPAEAVKISPPIFWTTINAALPTFPPEGFCIVQLPFVRVCSISLVVAQATPPAIQRVRKFVP